MAKLVSFLLCDAMQQMPTQNGSVPVLVAPQIGLRPQFVPGNFSFVISAGFADVDLCAANRMRVTVASPGGALVYDSGENELPVEQGDSVLPREAQGFMLTMDVRNMAVPEEGAYPVSFFLNGACVCTCQIQVYRRAV